MPFYLVPCSLPKHVHVMILSIENALIWKCWFYSFSTHVFPLETLQPTFSFLVNVVVGLISQNEFEMGSLFLFELFLHLSIDIFYAGFMCNCVLPVTLNSTKVRHHRIDDKPIEGEKKKLTIESNVLTSSNSSSSSSPTTTTRRGRSRTRRPLPPSSPLVVSSSASW